jgi:hypothetical protein
MREDATTDDYRRAPGGVGPLAGEWADKLHRLIYDLAGEIGTLRAENARMKALLQAWVEPWNGFDDVQTARRTDYATLVRIKATRAALAPQEPGHE